MAGSRNLDLFSTMEDVDLFYDCPTILVWTNLFPLGPTHSS